jgi:hypothetical protein
MIQKMADFVTTIGHSVTFNMLFLSKEGMFAFNIDITVVVYDLQVTTIICKDIILTEKGRAHMSHMIPISVSNL